MKHLARHIAAHCVAEYTDRLLVAVSGGADSVTLLDALVCQGFCCVVAHCNFHLRGEASDGDAEFVRSLSGSYGVEYCQADFDTVAVAGHRKISIEMAARELRYEWFEKIADEHDCKYIVVAHNADDAVETFFLNLMRGTGIDGLCGMTGRRGRILRPMLTVSRDDIMEYIAERGLKYRTDATNGDTAYRRNNIRHNVLPVFREMNPSFKTTMQRNMARIAAANEIVGDYSERAERECVTEQDGVTKIDIDKLQSKKGVEVLLFDWTRRFEFSSDVVEQMKDALDGISGKEFLSENYRAIINRGFLEIRPRKTDSDAGEYLIAEDVREIREPLHMTLEFVGKCDFNLCRSASVASFDAGKLRYPLLLRRWRHGDRFVPFGMRKHKKLSDFFCDAKLSIEDKENVWLLCSGDDIVWVVGMRIDGRYAITGDTERILTIRI